MIASLSGRVTAVGLDFAVIEVGGVGIMAMLTPTAAASIRIGGMVTLHTSLVVREDSLTLYGFLESDERALFDLVQTASGVGPKLAQAMLSVLTPEVLRRAILHEEFATLESVPGIGRKGAQRIVLELKDRIGGIPGPVAAASSDWRDQVLTALIGLGFSSREASTALSAAEEELGSTDVDVQSMLRSALRSRGRG